MEMYIPEIETNKFCGIEGTEFHLGVPFLKYLCTEVFNDEPGAKEVYEELAANMNPRYDIVYYITPDKESAKAVLWTACDIIADYITGLLKRRFGPKIFGDPLYHCQIPVAIYAKHLHKLGAECLNLNFDFVEYEVLEQDEYEDISIRRMWFLITCP